MRIWTVAGAMAAVLALQWLAPLRAEVTLPEDFILVAHRGVVTEDITENSLPALEETIRRGYTHIEVDIRCTKDGHAIAFHDNDLNRIAGVDKKVPELTLAELRKSVSEETAPTFAKFCEVAAGRIKLMPDVKGAPPELKEAYTKSIDDAMTKHDLHDGALFIGRPDITRKFLDKGGKLAWRRTLEHTTDSSHFDEDTPKHYFIFNHAEDFDQETVDGFQELGFEVIVSINTFHYPTDDPIEQGLADVQRMVSYGVDGLQIDSVYDTILPMKER